MAEQRATIGGVTCDVAGPVAWAMIPGVAPYKLTLQMHKSAADEVLKLLGEKTTIEVRGNGGFKAEGVYVIGATGSSDPIYGSVVVADKRWLWQREHILRRYNIPTRTGNKRIVNAGNQVPELELIADGLRYKRFSMKGGIAHWTASEVLEDVLARLGGGIIRDGARSDTLPIENLELDDAGPDAMARALSFVPSAGVYVDMRGQAIVYNVRDRDEVRHLLDASEPKLLGGGAATYVKLKHVRPKEIHVLFTREVELRFDSRTEGSESDGQGTFDAGAASQGALEMSNVLPIPDLSLDVEGRTLYRGTWCSVAKVVEAWNETPLVGAGSPITMENLRRYWFHGWENWAQLSAREPDADWVARLATLRKHYRQTYMLPANWMERIRSLIGSLVSIVDPATKARAPALVEADYCIEPGEKAKMYGSRTNSGDFALWMNVHGYPTDGKLATGHPAPAVLQILDDQLGVLRFDYVADPTRRASAIHPSICVTEDGSEGVPTHDFRYEGLKIFPPTCDAKVTGTRGWMQLSENHRCLCVLTAIPGAPNNEKQLQRIVVKPGDLKGTLAPGIDLDGDGPPWQVRVSPGMLSARFLWDDGQASLYPEIFGFGQANPDKAGIPESARLDEIWQNSDDCHQLAQAMAVSVYSMLSDHYEGAQRIHVKSDVSVVGNVAGVQHVLGPKGDLMTTIVLNGEQKTVDSLAYMDPGTRAIILGLVAARHWQ